MPIDVQTLAVARKLADGGGGSGGTTNYNELSNKPQINSITLSGDKSTEDLIPIGDGLEFDNDGKLKAVVTKAVNDLLNYYTKSNVYTKAEIDIIIENAKNAHFVVVAELPSSDIDKNAIYLVPKSTAQTDNDYDEYIYALKSTNPETYGWEKIGDTEIDLSGYVTTSDLNTALADYTTTADLTTLLAGKQNTLTFDSTPTAQSTNPVTSDGIKTYVDTQIENAHIYGVEWDGSSTTKWTRTDASRYFAEPQPAINNGNGYSPFDNVFPWAGMVVIDDPVAGSLVSIPKFWYKWTRNGSAMKLQIADAPVDGFRVSPAHMDRGDGAGERDVVYIGRYHCASDYTSKTGVTPLSNKTKADFRSGIHTLGSKIWQNDYAMFWTIRMLYLVEFADWDSQVKIGYGCGDGSALGNMGYTDNMKYHTGTTQASKDTYGLGVQYRYIEGLWDNVCDFCEGIYFSSSSIYGILNPADFSETTGGTLIGYRPVTTGAISKMTEPDESGFEWTVYASEVNGSDTTYVTDNCDYNNNGGLCVGGSYTPQTKLYGLFYLNGALTSQVGKHATIGSRLMVLP